MSISIPEKHIAKAIARFEARTKKQEASTDDGINARIITLSRDYGTGGREIGEKVAKALGFTLWGREILDVLASQSGFELQARMFEALDEKAQGAIDAVVADFFGTLERHNYFHLLPKAICMIAQENAVIVGRGAHLILPHAFRVKIEASLSTRISAVAALEGLDEASARKKVISIDKDRAGFIKQLGKVMIVKPEEVYYDLRINVDNISHENAAQTILDVFDRWVNVKK